MYLERVHVFPRMIASFAPHTTTTTTMDPALLAKARIFLTAEKLSMV